MTEDLQTKLQQAIQEAHSAPKASVEFGGFTQNAVFAPARKAVEAFIKLRKEIEDANGMEADNAINSSIEATAGEATRR